MEKMQRFMRKQSGSGILVVLGILAILAVIAIFAFGRSLLFSVAVSEIVDDGDNAKTFRTAVSAAPLLCSLNLSEKEKANLDLLVQAYSFAKEKSVECGGSFSKLNKCLDKYAGDLVGAVLNDVASDSDDLGDGILDAIGSLWDSGKKLVKKARAVYSAERHIRKSLRRAIARAKMIETFDRTDEEAKKGILAFLQYLDSIEIDDILLRGGDVQAGIGERWNEARSASLKWATIAEGNFSATLLYLSLDDKARGEFFGEPKIAALIKASSVWEASFNQACTPDDIVSDFPHILKNTLGFADKIGKL